MHQTVWWPALFTILFFFSSYGVLLSSSLVCKDLEADIYSIYSIRCLSIIVPIYHLVRRVMFCWHMSELILLCFPFFNINKYCFGYCKFIYIKTHYILKGSCEQSELIDININDALYANNHLLWQKISLLFLKNKTYLYAELTIRFSRVLMLNKGNYGYAMKTGLQKI